MGDFYSKKLKEQIGPLNRAFIVSLTTGPDPKYEKQLREANRDYREKIVANRDAAILIIVELLRYQNWANS